MILALKTDRPEAELHLLSDDKTIASYSWHAHRQLSNTLLEKIDMFLKKYGYTLESITGIIVYRGPGSFTGLRIAITAANTLGYGLDVPVAGGVSENWMQDGLRSLDKAESFQYVLPLYGSAPIITKPRK